MGFLGEKMLLSWETGTNKVEEQPEPPSVLFHTPTLLPYSKKHMAFQVHMYVFPACRSGTEDKTIKRAGARNKVQTGLRKTPNIKAVSQQHVKDSLRFLLLLLHHLKTNTQGRFYCYLLLWLKKKKTE